MINRRPLTCRGCQSKIVTRTQIGLGESQTHAFACPECGVSISFTIDLDQQQAAFSYRQPKNADWTDNEEGAIGAVALSQEIPVPTEGYHGFAKSTDFKLSPFIATVGRLENYEEYRRSEELRLGFVARFEEIERSITHFERSDWSLFDATMGMGEKDPTATARLTDLYGAIESGLSLFTRTPSSRRDRIRQRLILASVKEPRLIRELGELMVDSGRMVNLWRQIAENRRLFVSEYNSLQPLVQMRYWREELRTVTTFAVSTKRFAELRQLFLNTYETLCRLLVIGKTVEAVIHVATLDIPLSKRSVGLDEFETFANGVKCDHFATMVVWDLFEHALDRDLRNGIGHNAAHYDAQSDEISLVTSKGGATLTRRIGYTDFCNRVLNLFEAAELASVYHHWLHIHVDGRLT